jgi:hypothetical protein
MVKDIAKNMAVYMGLHARNPWMHQKGCETMDVMWLLHGFIWFYMVS